MANSIKSKYWRRITHIGVTEKKKKKKKKKTKKKKEIDNGTI